MKVDINKIIDFSKRVKAQREDNIPRIWTKKEIVDLIVSTLEVLKIRNGK